MLKIITILISIIFSGSVFASTENEYTSGNHYVIGLTPSINWVTGNKTQNIYLQPGIAKTYTDNNDTTYFPGGEVFIGLQKPMMAYYIKQPIITELGFSIVQTGNAKLSGDIWEDTNPEFNNFTYNYKISHTHVALKGRLISNSNMFVEPYASASIGVGFNRAYDFSSQAKIAGEIPSPPFNSKTTTTFVYTLGVGLQKALTTNLQIAVGYEFADWGKTQLSRANGQTLTQGLTLNNLYSNQLQLSLFYIF